MADTPTAALLWLIGGIFGAHHLYLKRYCHAFAWFCTGGGFLVGLLWDLCALPDYVLECNDPKSRIKNFSTGKTAPCSTIRFIGQLVLGSWLGFVAVLAVYSLTENPLAVATAAAVGTTWGVYVIGNLGYQERNPLYVWIPCFATAFVFIAPFGNYNGIIFAAIAGTLVGNRVAQYRTNPKPAFGYGHFFIWSAIYSTLVAIFLSHTASVVLQSEVTVNGRRTTIGGVLFGQGEGSVFGSQFYYERTTRQQRKFTASFGWRDFLSVFLLDAWREGQLDRPVMDAYALSTLNLDPYSTAEEIHARCQHLLKETHPDRAGEQSEARFISVRKACEILDKRKARMREKKAGRSRPSGAESA